MTDRDALRGLVRLIQKRGARAIEESPEFGAAREALDEADGEPCAKCGGETLLDLSVAMGETYSGRCTNCGASFWGSRRPAPTTRTSFQVDLDSTL